ncbi:glycosyltransferase family 2 protein [Treponema sp. C6A8]|uniref:glycosyltransferase family 2 protein n=1 Tax=Treponema sp. C6A8 TaxID=1410609 RepID=UPI0004888A4D|nr:glycosyltransferase family 2 protein [Treponema sp. C6A8]
MNTDISDISVVICTRNNKNNIQTVVQSVLIQNPGELIVVDGNSSDGTKEILEKMPVKVLTDPGKGLALARQIALDVVQCKYTLFVGDDNVVPDGNIAKLKQYMLNHDWVGAAFQTRIKEAEVNYWSYCANWRWITRFFEGERDVIGTPYIFYTDLLKKAKYDEFCTDSDDSDIEERIKKITSKKFGYSNLECFEIGKTSFLETKKRFLIYGKSDAQFWNKYKNGWKVKRKILSIIHPFKDELINPLKRIKSFRIRLKVFPYFFYITIVRYIGWVKEINIIRNKQK